MNNIILHKTSAILPVTTNNEDKRLVHGITPTITIEASKLIKYGLSSGTEIIVHIARETTNNTSNTSLSNIASIEIILLGFRFVNKDCAICPLTGEKVTNHIGSKYMECYPRHAPHGKWKYIPKSVILSPYVTNSIVSSNKNELFTEIKYDILDNTNHYITENIHILNTSCNVCYNRSMFSVKLNSLFNLFGANFFDYIRQHVSSYVDSIYLHQNISNQGYEREKRLMINHYPCCSDDMWYQLWDYDNSVLI